jgi:multiple sugar transport system substrate-binding protein
MGGYTVGVLNRFRYFCLALILTALLGNVSLAANRPVVTIATYSQPRYLIIKDQLLPKWRNAHPDIDIQVLNFPDFWNKILVLMSTDQAPDIIDSAGTYLFSHVIRGGVIDLTPLLEGTLNQNSFFPGPWNEVRWPQPNGDSIYALPYDTVGSVLWYNKEILRNMGVAQPSANWTWDMLRSVAKKLARDDNGDGALEIVGFSYQTNHEGLDAIIKAFGGQLLSPDRMGAAINNPQTAAAIQFLNDMRQVDRSTGIGSSFAQGVVGLFAGSTYNITTIGRIEGLDWGVTVLPAGPATRNTYGGSNMWEVLKRPGQDLQAIKVVLTELLSQETIEAFWTSYTSPYSLPAVRSVASRTKLNVIQQALAESVTFMTDGDWSPDWSAWQSAKRREIEPALRGERSIQESLERAAQEIDIVLKKAYGLIK